MFRRIQWRVLVLFVLFLTACQTLTPPSPTIVPLSTTPTRSISPIPPTRPPTLASPTRSQVSLTDSNYRVEIAMFDANARTAINANVGSTASLTIDFRAYKDVVTAWSDGTTTKYSTDWSPNTLAEMRYCAGVGRTCTLPAQWVPFAARQTVNITVDWVGQKDYGVTAQFRDANGKIIPAGYSATDSASNWVPVTGAIDDRTPIAAQPPRIQTIIAQARNAFPVVGKIQVGEGHPVGGKAGSRVNIVVKFEATSPGGQVTEMRVKQWPMGICLTPDEMNDAPWEPFVAQKVYPVSVGLNWTTFKLHVQYRDAKGNLSQVYCGDVAVEGSP